MLQDLRYAARGLRRRWVSSTAIVLCLSLGIGLNAAVFSYIDKTLLNPLPYPEPGRLVVIWGTESFEVPRALDRTLLRAWSTSPRELESVGPFELISFAVHLGSDRVETSKATRIGPEVFSVLRTGAVLGRTFSLEDGAVDATTPVVISYNLWRDSFGFDDHIIGRTLLVNGAPHTILGVMPSGFFFPDFDVDLWLPIFPTSPQPREVQFVGRLRENSSPEQAQNELAQFLRANEAGHKRAYSAGVFPYRRLIIGEHERASWLLFASMWALLLATCVNVSGWLLSRGVEGARDSSVRISIGAGLSRQISATLAEPVLLTLGSGVASLMWAYAGIRLLRASDAAAMPLIGFVSLDWRTFGYIATLAAASGVVAGITPLVFLHRASRSFFRSGHHSTPSRSIARVRSSLLAAQIALVVVLLVSMSLLVSSFANVVRIDWGFRPEGVLVVETRLPGRAAATQGRDQAFTNTVVEKLRTMPGVESAAATVGVPIRWTRWDPSRFDVGGRMLSAGVWVVGSGYFHTLGVPIIEGREFREDDSPSARFVVVNESFAKMAWGGRVPLSRQISYLRYRPRAQVDIKEVPGGLRAPNDPGIWQPDPTPLTVIGVTKDIRMFGLGYSTGPAVYMDGRNPLYPIRLSTFALRTKAGNESRLVSYVSSQILAADQSARVTGSFKLSDLVAGSIAGRGSLRLVTLASVLLGTLALIVSATGIYGVTSLLVAQRMREVALRKALGANQVHVAKALFRRDAIAILIGISVGIPVAMGIARVSRSLLVGIAPTDPPSYVVAVLLIVIVAIVASWEPLRRAMRSNPAELLRSEP